MDNLLNKQSFDLYDIENLLQTDGEQMQYLFSKALEKKLSYVDNKVRLRGLIEYSNKCEKNCLYCGLGCKNTKPARYEMTEEDVIQSSLLAMNLRFGSIAIQCGERTDKEHIEKITKLIKTIKEKSNNALGITLSCGEQSRDTYKQWFEAGAHRYLLRIESSNPELYRKIHPHNDKHSYQNRIDCLKYLKEIGYQVGTGVMIGLPFQTTKDLAQDILFFKDMDVAMVGMGPYIVDNDTALGKFKDIIPSKEDRLDMTLKMIAITRLVMPEINIVSSTANQVLNPNGRQKAISVGANVIMPNLTPVKYRQEYMLYPNKDRVNDTIFDIHSLEQELKAINHSILYDTWGDSLAFTKRNK